MMKRRDIAGTRLGGLEAEVRERLWAAGERLGVRELAGLLHGPARASTTIVTVLTHLMDKGLVERAGDGRRYTYRPAGDPDQLTARAIERLLAAAGDRRAGPAPPGHRAQRPAPPPPPAAPLPRTPRDGDAEGPPRATPPCRPP